MSKAADLWAIADKALDEAIAASQELHEHLMIAKVKLQAVKKTCGIEEEANGEKGTT